VVCQLAGLHGLDAGNDGLLNGIGLFDEPSPVFEFLVVVRAQTNRSTSTTAPTGGWISSRNASERYIHRL
jgi:hypothetical protein